ncbi:VanZ family protein [Evansella vedderi]|uniref:VanZ family protein n=1 Tax=Evansella vedderi TaxID=38282 RepID=A0ABU0A0L2_9BACI|nr:VanZ family protein [Evansella vedderi]MDQ0256659.1 VanZ family protein [Evansella vedderi]
MFTKEKRRLLIHYILPFAAWVGLIHYSSSQSYEDQNVQPILQGLPLDWVESLFWWVSFQYGDSVVSLQTRSPEAFIEFFIRKGAHLFVFAVLGILAYRLLNQFLKKRAHCAIYAWLFVTIYAGIDEFRQMLHPNRSGMVEDVILDSIGGVIGISLWVFWKSRRT